MFTLYLVMPLVAVPETLLRELEGHAMGFDWGWATPLSEFTGRFDGWRPPRQLITLRFSSGVEVVLGGGGVYHVFISQICVTWVP